MGSRLLYISGNQFGLKRVVLDEERGLHVLLNDETRHGMQSTDAPRTLEPLAYYHRAGPLGEVFSSWHPQAAIPQIAAIGLGVGCMASYLELGQHMTFYEIDPGVAQIAVDPRYFTFLSKCRGTYDIVLGDAAETFPRSIDRVFDMIILDAFVGGSIPLPLITDELLQAYLDRLTEKGVILFHISDNNASIQASLNTWVNHRQLAGLNRADGNITDEQRQHGRLPSKYMIVARKPNVLRSWAENPLWTPVESP